MLTAGCESAPHPAADGDRGRLVTAEHLRAYSRDEVSALLQSNEFDSGTARFGVDTYRLTYDTIGADGRATTASGLLALPLDDHTDLTDLTTVAFEHGTQPTKAAAPSVAGDGGDVAATLTYASAGFAGVAPDYLGLGLGPGPHPYLDIPSETTASLDMLRAARAHVQTLGRRLRGEVDIVGFSQGGPAALGLVRALQANADKDFHPNAVASIAGPLAIRAAELPALFDGTLDPGEGSFYTSYLLVSWNRLHGLYRAPSEVFQAPYDTTLEQLFDGTHPFEDIVKGLAPDIEHLLTPHGLDLLRNPTGPFADALAVADSTCSDWTPHLPVRLYTGSADRDVAPANSAACLTALRGHGVDAQLTDVGPVDHSGSGKRGTAQAVRWFLEAGTRN
ncbi:lipase [Nocardia yunnanensis]|uniref:Lipase n=1 Tax=Nocardia yunnanensis TaxID=2382165 RepID=A0A386ZNT9_9NOCA|nr:lipase [Nocardia yunnanensis]